MNSIINSNIKIESKYKTRKEIMMKFKIILMSLVTMIVTAAFAASPKMKSNVKVKSFENF